MYSEHIFWGAFYIVSISLTLLSALLPLLSLFFWQYRFELILFGQNHIKYKWNGSICAICMPNKQLYHGPTSSIIAFFSISSYAYALVMDYVLVFHCRISNFSVSCSFFLAKFLVIKLLCHSFEFERNNFFSTTHFYLRLVKQYNCYFLSWDENFAVEIHVFFSFTWCCYVENQRWNQSKMDERLESGFDIKMKHFGSRNNFWLAYLSVQCSRRTMHWQLTSFGGIPPRISSNVLFVCNLFLLFRKLKQQCQRCGTKATWDYTECKW